MTKCRNCDRDGHPVVVGGWTGWYLCIAHMAILMARLSFDQPEGEAGFVQWLRDVALTALSPSIVVDGKVVLAADVAAVLNVDWEAFLDAAREVAS